MAGSLAPFIELGVGFNTDLTARGEHRPQRGDDGPDPQEARGADRRRPRASPSSRSSST